MASILNAERTRKVALLAKIFALGIMKPSAYDLGQFLRPRTNIFPVYPITFQTVNNIYLSI